MMIIKGQFYLIWVILMVVAGLPVSYCSVENYNLHGRNGDGYYVEAQIGTPPQIFNFLVDTGSANLAVAALPVCNLDGYFNKSLSSTFIPHNEEVTVTYTQGNWSGEQASDVLAFPSLNITALRSDIGLIDTVNNFFLNGSKWQGILGLAYPYIGKPDDKIKTWLDAYANTTTSVAFSLELCGTASEESHAGKFRMLQSDETPRLPILKTPVVKEWFYEVVLTKLEIGGELLNVPCYDLNNKRTIVDSGTTNLRVTDKIFPIFLEVLRKHVGRNLSEEFYTSQKAICLQESELHHLDLRHFFPHISLSLMQSESSYFTLEIGPESYVRKFDDYCYKLMVTGSPISGTVLGTTLIEGYNVVFNRTGKYVGFCPSPCGPSVNMYGPFETKEDLSKCNYQNFIASSSSPIVEAVNIVGYTVTAMMGFVLVFVVYFLIKWVWVSYLQRPDWSSLSQSNLLTQE